MIQGACHCGAVRWTVPAEPDWLSSCTCSYCSRIGALWAAYTVSEVCVEHARDAVIAYTHGDRTLAFVSCATCGCTTHWRPAGSAPGDARMKVNMRVAVGYDISGLRRRVFDGADSWRYLDE
jgi:hypothetical protein